MHINGPRCEGGTQGRSVVGKESRRRRKNSFKGLKGENEAERLRAGVRGGGGERERNRI